MKRNRYGEERRRRSRKKRYADFKEEERKSKKKAKRKRYADFKEEEEEGRRTSKRKRMNVDIPTDVLVDILSRLPARCAWKLRSVCKEWKSLIESPCFADLQLRRQSKEDNNTIFMFWSYDYGRGYNETRFYSIDKYGEADRVIEDKFFGHRCDTKTSSVNGLICYYGGSDFNIKVRNPVTREKITLPKPSFLSPPKYEYAPLYLDLGIGFDSTTNTYKVLASSIYNPPQLEIFTLGDGTWTWRKLQLPSAPHITSYCEGGFFANGCAFWLTSTSKWEKHEYENGCFVIPLVPFIFADEKKHKDEFMLGTLMTFNFAQEKFENFPFPPDIEISSTTSHWINQVGGRASLIQAKLETNMVKIWTLAPDSSATQLWVPHIALLPHFQKSLREPALFPIPNGVMLFKPAKVYKEGFTIKRYICFYNQQGQVVKSIRIHGIPNRFSPLQLHTESLVSLKSILAANL